MEREKEIQTCTLKKEHFDLDSIGGLGREYLKEIQIDLNEWLSHKPHCLGGRATAVLGSLNPNHATRGELACKISFPGIARENEGRVIEELLEEIDQDDETRQLSKHLPDVLMYGDMSRYGAQSIRSMLKLAIGECRTLRILVSRKMAPLTSVAGAEFVKAWLEVVRFHAFLWSRNFEHCDPSLWNIMYNKDLKCGVLSDYDLSISRRQPRVPGTDRTGTIPFMAIDLLTDKYWLQPKYRHELEAFIWMLLFVFLRYQNGMSQKGTPVDQWITSNYIACSKKKSHFLKISQLSEKAELCQSDFKDHWKLVEHLLAWWAAWLASFEFNVRDHYVRTGEISDEGGVASMWPLFVAQLRLASKRYSSHLGYVDNLIDELELERPFGVQRVTRA